MKTLLVAAIIALITNGSAQIFPKIDQNIKFENYNPLNLVKTLPGYGKSWMYFPDGNGVPQIATLDIPKVIPKLYSPTEQYVKFHLYTRKNLNDSQVIEVDNVQKLNASNYDFAKPTKFVSHGWISSYKSQSIQNIKNYFLEADEYNVILINWNDISSNVIYPIPMAETKSVGQHVAKMVDFLTENGARHEDIHLIGHSLGAHIVGNAGAAVKNKKVGRITGLDPALPGFELITGEDGRLDQSDGDFVDVIHTCGGVLGYYSKIGHVDFYPNGGVPSQPGCSGLPQIIEGCSHGRAWDYFSESIKIPNGFMANTCDSWSTYKSGDCTNTTSIPMGLATPKTARGVYFLKTQPKWPFSANKSENDAVGFVESGVNEVKNLAQAVLPSFG